MIKGVARAGGTATGGQSRSRVCSVRRLGHGELAERQVLRDVVDRKVKARMVREVKNIEAVPQPNPLRNLRHLHNREVGALLPRLAENVALPLEQYSKFSAKDISEVVSMKLALVGLKGFEEFYPAEISGGMRKRAGLARAMALDPALLFFDEPSAGLDPLTSRRLDDLILRLRDSLGPTIVVVTHELPSIFTIADTSIFLDAETKQMIAHGDPKELVKEGRSDPKVREFLLRGDPKKTPIGLPKETESETSVPSRI